MENNRYLTAEDVVRGHYIAIPTALFTAEKYKDMSLTAKMAYSVLLDRSRLSQRNHWVDDQGRVYVIYSRQSLADFLNCGIKKASQVMTELVNFDLIEEQRRGLTMPNLIFPKLLELTDEDLHTDEDENGTHDVPNTDILNGEKDHSETAEKGTQEFPKVPTSQHNINQHEIIYREISQSVCLSAGDGLTEQIRKQIEYDYFREHYPDKLPLVDVIVEHMAQRPDKYGLADGELILGFLEKLNCKIGDGYLRDVENRKKYALTMFDNYIGEEAVYLA